MEFSSSNYILSSNGCLNETDYNLHIKEEKSDIIFQNSGSMVNSKALTQHQDNKSNIIENDIKQMPQSICENQKNSEMKRKLTKLEQLNQDQENLLKLGLHQNFRLQLLLFVLFEWPPSQRKEVGIPIGILPQVWEQNKHSYFPRQGQS